MPLYLLGFHGYGYFQAEAAAAQTSPNAQAAANGILPPNNEQRQNGSSYYADYASNNRNDSRGDYGRNGEMVQQISNQLTTGTSTPALVAQALSGTTTTTFLLPLLLMTLLLFSKG